MPVFKKSRKKVGKKVEKKKAVGRKARKKVGKAIKRPASVPVPATKKPEGNSSSSVTTGKRLEKKVKSQGRPSHTVVLDLGVENTPDPPRKKVARIPGVRTGLGVETFWRLLFEANESLPKASKMTDAEIKRQMIKEFPKARGIISLKEGRMTVATMRNLYNVGRVGGAPKLRAQKYKEDGTIDTTFLKNKGIKK